MKRVVILSTQEGDWEGLYIDGKLISEGHRLGEGDHQLYLLRMAKEFNFTIDDIIIREINDIDEEYVGSKGRFPEKLSGLSGAYQI